MILSPLKKFLVFTLCLFPILHSPLLNSVRADITLPAIISHHMVLQRSAQTRIWGKAAPSEKVSVTLGDIRAEAVADADGRWKVELNLTQAKEGPYDLTIEGSKKIVINDVIIGEVWLCSGQSNMAYSLNRSTGAADEIAKSTNPRLRQFTVSYNPTADPQDACKGYWLVSDPTNSPSFSAVAYYFAKDIQKNLNTPVGIVRSAWAGTAIMSWISDLGAATDPELKEMSDTAKKRIADYPKQKEDYVPAIKDWEAKTQRADRPFDEAAFVLSGIQDDDWKKVMLPKKFTELGLPDSGAIWFRRKMVLPAMPPKNQGLSMTFSVREFDAVYWNGQKIGGITEEKVSGSGMLRTYTIPREAYKEGENLIAIRVFNPTENSSFGGDMYVDIGTARIRLNGEWLAKTEYELPTLTDKSYPKIPSAPGVGPGYLFNGMVNPITSYTFAGVMWYQGEQDSGRTGSLYHKMLTTLIKDWREQLGAPLHFCICQLPNYGPKKNEPVSGTWAGIREAQRRALSLPNTSLVTLIDLGEEDVHPPDKKPAGERIALSALGTVYGQKIESSGPIYESIKVEGDKAIISFTHAESGLVAKQLPAEYLPTYSAKEKKPLVRNSPNSELEGFAICGEDKKWVWAQAKIEGSTVVVSSPSVQKPVSVRYAWGDNPTCNLYNAAGLPASSFQTDEMK